jgi:hypothetical protein
VVSLATRKVEQHRFWDEKMQPRRQDRLGPKKSCNREKQILRFACLRQAGSE